MATPDIGGVRPDEALALAHVRKVKAFYIHLGNYLGVIAMLAVINAVSDRGYWWFLWPAAGWGVGIVTHALSVFRLIPLFDGDWEKRQVEKRLQRNL